MTIYKITNLVTGKVYIGQTINELRKRWAQHKASKRKSPLRSSMMHHGVENFKIEPLCSALKKDYLNELEIYFIKSHNSVYPNGYNISTGGFSSSGHKPWNRGLKLTEEMKQKLSFAHKGQIPWNKGKKTPEHVKLKLSRAKLGKRVSPHSEFKAGETSTFKGKKHTPEALALISKNNAQSKKIYCIQLNTTYNSVREAARVLKISKNAIHRSLQTGESHRFLNLTFKYCKTTK